jgi:hypothetical protein
MANNLAAFNAEAWSKLLIANLDQINVMLGLVNQDWEGELRQVGDTVRVRTLGNITLGPYSKGQSISYQDLTPTVETMTISDAQYFAFNVDDIDRANSDLDALNLYAQRAAVALNNVIEAKILSRYVDAHADNRITGASNAAITLDASNVYDYFVEARSRLSKKNVPITGRWAVVDPDTVALLLKSDKFVRSTGLGDLTVTEGTMTQSPRPGFVGRIAGFDVYESNAIPVASGAKFLVFGDRYAISYAAKIQSVETIRLETTFATAVRGLLLHDAKVFAETSKRLAYIKAAV